jgi:nucleotide-binding universal stress UspA family protein
MSEPIFIVPHDFTFTADTALNHAVNISKQINAKVAIVHIVTKDSEKNEAEQKLQNLIKNHPEQNIEMNAHVIQGSIFTDIGKLAEELNASAIIMGTHGAKGMQKVFGSFAMKVIISTTVPFMVVQDNAEVNTLNNIVYAIDSSLESLQIASLAGNIAKLYNSKVHIIAGKETDAKYASKVKMNLTALSKKLNTLHVNHHLELIDTKGSWLDSIIDYANKVNADMFAIGYDSDKFFASNDKFAQSLLFNKAKIPTLIINSKNITKSDY